MVREEAGIFACSLMIYVTVLPYLVPADPPKKIIKTNEIESWQSNRYWLIFIWGDSKVRNDMSISRKSIVAAAALLLWPLQAGADTNGIGKFRLVSGESYVVRDGTRTKAVVGGELWRKDVIETASDGAVGVTFNDNTVFSAGPNSSVSMEEFKFNPVTLKGSFLAKLGKGTLSVVSGDIARGSPSAMRIRTPSAILGVRGTRFLVRVNEEK
jgi:hypothetical protein